MLTNMLPLLIPLLMAGVDGSAPLSFPPVWLYAPESISLVGTAGGVPSPAGMFQVRVLDKAMNPLFGATVLIDLSGCGDLKLCTDQRDPGALVDCAAKTVRKTTNVLGIATFTLLGGSIGYTSGGPTTLGQKAKIYVAAIPSYWITAAVCAYDLDGFAGVGANDLGIWLGDFGSGVAWARSDFDGDGWVGANDLSLWVEKFAEGTMQESCTATCP